MKINFWYNLLTKTVNLQCIQSSSFTKPPQNLSLSGSTRARQDEYGTTPCANEEATGSKKRKEGSQPQQLNRSSHCWNKPLKDVHCQRSRWTWWTTCPILTTNQKAPDAGSHCAQGKHRCIVYLCFVPHRLRKCAMTVPLLWSVFNSLLTVRILFFLFFVIYKTCISICFLKFYNFLDLTSIIMNMK